MAEWVYSSVSISGPGFVATFYPVEGAGVGEVEAATKYAAAAVNACTAAGLSVEDLEAGAVAALVEAVRFAKSWQFLRGQAMMSDALAPFDAEPDDWPDGVNDAAADFSVRNIID